MPQLDFDGLDGVLEVPPGQTNPGTMRVPLAENPKPTNQVVVDQPARVVDVEPREMRWPVIALASLAALTVVGVGATLFLKRAAKETAPTVAETKTAPLATASANVAAPAPTEAPRPAAEQAAAAPVEGKTAAEPTVGSAPVDMPTARTQKNEDVVASLTAAQPRAETAGTTRDLGELSTFPGKFTLNSIQPTGVTKAHLAELVKALQACGGNIQVIGHSCSLGTEAVQQWVGMGRARSVAQILSRAGVPAASMQVSSAGAKSPIGDNGTAAGRIQNRRVTFVCE